MTNDADDLSRIVMKDPVHLLAFGFGTGLAPFAPGTFGSLPGIFLFWLTMGFGAYVQFATAVAISLAGIFICSSDGLLLAQSVKEDKLKKVADPLSAVAPQLYKRGRRSLTQANLPECDMFTFFLGNNAVTFAGSEQLFCALLHDGQYPNQRQLRSSRKLVQELVWYCSHRAVL